MTDDRGQRIKELLDQLLDTPATQRASVLELVCAGDVELRSEVESLARAYDEGSDFFAPRPATEDFTSFHAVGSRIGRYLLVKQLGEGGFGTVFLAEQQDPVRRRVAVKLIKLGMDTKGVIARFSAERQALAMMDHPHIAHVYDAGATDAGRPYFVMELVEGVPITKFCDENKLTIRQRLGLFIQVCQAVQHAHTKGIIHRDLKPTNILVSDQDGAAVPKVIDFGIAKATQGRLTEQSFTTDERHWLGTPQYMSPEQADGSADIDTRTDVYSLGVILYELLAGAPPFSFKNCSYSEIQRIIREVDAAPPSSKSARRELRGDLDRIVLKAMEKDRSRRYGMAKALATDLERHLNYHPVAARGPSAVYRIGKMFRRNRMGIVGVAVGLVVAWAIVAAFWFLAYRQPYILHSTANAPESRISPSSAALAAFAVFTAALLGLFLGAGAWWRARRSRDGYEPQKTAPSRDHLVSRGAARRQSIAVLAFTNLSEDKAYEFFGDGVSEELLNLLARTPGLRVVPRASAFFFKGKNTPVPQIARQLNVAYVVDGSVRKAGDRVRISVQLIKGSDGSPVWSDTVTCDLKEVFSVQDEIAMVIAGELELELGATRPAARRVDPEAHRLVLEGRHFWLLRTHEGFARAENSYARAAQIDPLFAEAHAGLANVWAMRGWYELLRGNPHVGEDFGRAKAEARRALELDSRMAEPSAAMGAVLFNEGRLVEADRHFRHALRVNPNYSFAHHWHGHVMRAQGRLDVAIEGHEQAIARDPFSFITLTICCMDMAFAGRHAEALAMNDRAMALWFAQGKHDPYVPLYAERSQILHALGRMDEAVAAARVVTEDLARQPRWWSDAHAIHVLRAAGLESEAADRLDVLLASTPQESYLRGFLLAAGGGMDDAFSALLLARLPTVSRGPLFYAPFLHGLRQDQRFPGLLSQLGLEKDYQTARQTLVRMRR